ncbi:MAG TPA: neutral/alkaline non-lysosomal ceramidase N-terminal domain-containing protein, partial [Verrucomicrobiota bacterium]|nr:neutral/alkaline non-lysosomal ceramidase N-terminal domain-containing protein [Verrucomicrobiota bacterium]
MKALYALSLALAAPLSAATADFQAGVARVPITPPMPFWLTGYAARTNAAASVRTELWAKALALEDSRGGRAVLVTSDVIGLPREISDAVAERARKRHGLKRSEVLLNSSHTHAGPVIWPNLRVMFDFDEAEQARVVDYTRRLCDNLTAVIDAALDDLGPAHIASGHGAAHFAINRRQPASNGARIGQNRSGPVDHDVPVLSITGDDGTLRAVV